MSARVPIGSHHTVDALSLCHCVVVGCVTADSERAGLDSRTVGMMLGVVEVGSPFVHPVNMRTSWAVSYHNDSCLLVVVLVVPITCHCWHCSCVGHHHGGCNQSPY